MLSALPKRCRLLTVVAVWVSTDLGAVGIRAGVEDLSRANQIATTVKILDLFGNAVKIGTRRSVHRELDVVNTSNGVEPRRSACGRIDPKARLEVGLLIASGRRKEIDAVACQRARDRHVEAIRSTDYRHVDIPSRNVRPIRVPEGRSLGEAEVRQGPGTAARPRYRARERRKGKAKTAVCSERVERHDRK